MTCKLISGYVVNIVKSICFSESPVTTIFFFQNNFPTYTLKDNYQEPSSNKLSIYWNILNNGNPAHVKRLSL